MANSNKELHRKIFVEETGHKYFKQKSEKLKEKNSILFFLVFLLVLFIVFLIIFIVFNLK